MFDVDLEWLIDQKDVEYIKTICEHERVRIYTAFWRKHQVVCVKEIVVDDHNMKLVKREVDILSKCIHPKICQFLGAGISASRKVVFMLFEYMDIGNLSDYIKNATLGYDKKNEILRSILVGMHYLSSRIPQKIIHRDFKPSNILVNSHGEIKISDFGVSKELYNLGPKMKTSKSLNFLTISHATESSDDISHTGIGTLRWTAPEVVLDDCTYDETCDIYSFGLLAFYVITDGVIPYYNEYQSNLAQIAFAKSGNIRPFLDNPSLIQYPVYKDMIQSCTEKDPSLRPRDASAILEKYFK
jgi:serine/threonine protein kinase